MFMILLRFRLTDEAGEEFHATEDLLRERVRAVAGSDLIEIKQYVGEDGERLGVIFWQNPETLEKWRTDPVHRAAQQMAREHWYSSYELTVGEVVRTSTGGVSTSAPGGTTSGGHG